MASAAVGYSELIRKLKQVKVLTYEGKVLAGELRPKTRTDPSEVFGQGAVDWLVVQMNELIKRRQDKIKRSL